MITLRKVKFFKEVEIYNIGKAENVFVHRYMTLKTINSITMHDINIDYVIPIYGRRRGKRGLSQSVH